MSHPQLALDKQLCHRLYMASNRVTRYYRDFLGELQLTYPQYVVMMALWEEDQISINALLKKTAIDGGAMTLILKKMSDKDLLCIEKSDKDKRKRIVKLSEKGRALSDSAALIPEQMRCAFQVLDDSELQQLIVLLDKVNQQD